MAKIFIDGSVGTTGLRIHERLSARSDIQVVTLPDAVRKDTEARREALNACDVAFLCLPDAAAIEAVAMVDNANTAIIDTSTAHRTADGWAYGFPELAGQREKIAASKRIANPGCHASGFVALVAPLVKAGIVGTDAALTCTSLTGYSGGGKKMIAEYDDEARNVLLDAPRQYGLTQKHKHLPEMSAYCALEYAPVFMPIVADYYAGMEVTVPLFAKDIKGTAADIKEVYRACYNSRILHFDKNCDEGGFVAANALSGRDDMQITVSGNDERILLIARFDNLGKGASGAAIQNMNIILGLDETTGLNV